MKGYFNVGKITGTFGLNGEVVLRHHLGKAANFNGVEVLFVEERRGSLLPWFIGSAKVKNTEETYIHFDTLQTKEAAQKLVQKPVWVPEEVFRKIADKSTPAQLLDYIVFDGRKELGKVLEVIEQAQQLLCRIEIDNKEVYIPVNQSTLLTIDHKARRVYTELPEGLLEIYLG